MVNLFHSIFRRKKQRDQAAVVEEVWIPSFRSERKSRFQTEKTDSVQSGINQRTLDLKLKKKNVFGWAENPWYKYRDFVIEAQIDLDPSNGHSSVGFLLRRADELNYYFFLISPSGNFRFDVVFNGTPQTLINWTECPAFTDAMRLRILARGAYFGFYLDEEWIGETEDDTIYAGGITFAAQNYNEKETATYRLISLTLDSRPYEIEAQYYRWRRYVPVEPQRRLNLAKSLALDANYSAAILQFTLAGNRKNFHLEDLMLLCECQVRSGLHAEAMVTVDNVLEIDGNNLSALAQRANLLYLDNRIIELRDFLINHDSLREGNAVMWNLLGNAWYALGNREEAVVAYDMACEIDPSLPIYRINAARSWEYLGKPQKAFAGYLDASKMLFREEEYSELSGLLALIERLSPGNPEVLALKGKIAFGEKNYADAEEHFAWVLETGTDDSSVHYLYGILLSQQGKRVESCGYLERATQLEPDYYLYWFRLGENKHVRGADAEADVLRALALAPNDMWVLNLAGLVYLEQDRNGEALEMFEKAHCQIEQMDDTEGPGPEGRGPDHDDIIANYAEALFRTGNGTLAYELLDGRTNTPLLLNQLGNLHALDGDYESAAEAYERAVRLAPNDRNILLNCAAACIESDRVLRAEEILSRILDQDHDSGAYNLMGNAAQIKGEYLRAEAAYIEAMRADPDNEEAAVNMADLYVLIGRYADAKSTIEKYLSGVYTPRLASLRDSVRRKTEMDIPCACCGRVWSVDRDTDDQPTLKLRGELPDESPAGRCPDCSKVYCIACAKPTLDGGRFHCPDCKKALKLSDNHLRLIVSRYVP